MQFELGEHTARPEGQIKAVKNQKGRDNGEPHADAVRQSAKQEPAERNRRIGGHHNAEQDEGDSYAVAWRVKLDETKKEAPKSEIFFGVLSCKAMPLDQILLCAGPEKV